jgi:hypothetical protein
VVRTLDSGRFSISDPATEQNIRRGNSGNRDSANDTKIEPFSGWDWDGRLRIESSTPDKLEVLGVVTDLEFEAGGRR